MKTRITYKELSLLAGILVAAIIVLTVWMTDTKAVSIKEQRVTIPRLSSQSHTVKLFKRLISTNTDVLY